MSPFLAYSVGVLADIVARSVAAKALASYVLAAMLSLAPVDAVRATPESPESIVHRYRGIALAIATAAVTPRGAETAVALSEGQRRAAVLIGIARHESGPFEKDVDVGPCKGAAAHCDGGRSVGVLQVMAPTKALRDLYQRDRFAMADEAMRRALSSESACRGGEPYAAYSSGSCDRGRVAAAELRRYVAHAQMVLARVIARASDPYAD